MSNNKPVAINLDKIKKGGVLVAVDKQDIDNVVKQVEILVNKVGIIEGNVQDISTLTKESVKVQTEISHLMISVSNLLKQLEKQNSEINSIKTSLEVNNTKWKTTQVVLYILAVGLTTAISKLFFI